MQIRHRESHQLAIADSSLRRPHDGAGHAIALAHQFRAGRMVLPVTGTQDLANFRMAEFVKERQPTQRRKLLLTVHPVTVDT